MGGAVHRPFGVTARGTAGSRSLTEVDVPGLCMGQRVMHAKFGEGIVVQSEGSGDRARVQINFQEAGAKWLMMGYARLDPLD